MSGHVRDVAARTEAYWYPIKHARRWPGGHTRYAAVTECGDEDHLAKREASREHLRDGA